MFTVHTFILCQMSDTLSFLYASSTITTLEMLIISIVGWPRQADFVRGSFGHDSLGNASD